MSSGAAAHLPPSVFLRPPSLDLTGRSREIAYPPDCLGPKRTHGHTRSKRIIYNIRERPGDKKLECEKDSEKWIVHVPCREKLLGKFFSRSLRGCSSFSPPSWPKEMQRAMRRPWRGKFREETVRVVPFFSNLSVGLSFCAASVWILNCMSTAPCTNVTK